MLYWCDINFVLNTMINYFVCIYGLCLLFIMAIPHQSMSFFKMDYVRDHESHALVFFVCYHLVSSSPSSPFTLANALAWLCFKVSELDSAMFFEQ